MKLRLGSTHGAPSESDVAPMLLQSRTKLSYVRHMSGAASEPGLRGHKQGK